MEAANDTKRLRDAFGCFGTGVTLVAALDEAGAPVALTANSFSSVSLEPPLLLFCIDRRSRRLPAFERAEAWGVSVLHAGQEAISVGFARGGVEFDLLWTAVEGAPVLADAMASFACVRHAVHDAGDHLIFIGRVLQLSFDPTQDPLIYFQGRYRSVHVPD